MTGRNRTADLLISKLLRQSVDIYNSIFPQVAAGIQLSCAGKTPMRGESIQYIYTNSKHKNPLFRVVVPELTEQQPQGLS